MFGSKKKQRNQLHGDDPEIGRYLEAAVCAAQEALTHGGILITDPDFDDWTLADVLSAGPDIMCATAGLPGGVIEWVCREAAYRTAVAYARDHDQHVGRGDDAAIQKVIDELSRQPRDVQAGYLNVAAVLP